MSVLGHISLKFHPSPAPSHTLAILRNAGWGFSDSLVLYEHHSDGDGLGEYKEAPVAEWTRLSAFVDTRFQEGETVSVLLVFEGTKSHVWFNFRHEEEGIQEMWASICDPRPRLCGRFTDFGWYLPKIVCPLYEAQHNILEVNCNDDAY